VKGGGGFQGTLQTLIDVATETERVDEILMGKWRERERERERDDTNVQNEGRWWLSWHAANVD
jgi:hypothetical protein